MTGIVVLLYVAVGVGCGLIRLSAVAVGIIAVIPAVVGMFAVSEKGALSMLVAAMVPLLVIEGVYFLTMIATGKLWATTPAASAEASQPTAEELRFPRKPQMGEEP
jgi:hypothetical protein